MDLTVPSSCADFVPHPQAPLLGAGSLLSLFERVFCPHPSFTALFLKYPTSAINPAINSPNTYTPDSLTWPLTSPLHTLIHPHRSSHSLLPSTVLRHLSKFGVLPAVKVILSEARLALSASPRFSYLFTAHPTLLLANILSLADITCTTPCII